MALVPDPPLFRPRQKRNQGMDGRPLADPRAVMAPAFSGGGASFLTIAPSNHISIERVEQYVRHGERVQNGVGAILRLLQEARR